VTGSVAAASRTDTSWPYAYPCRPGETGSAAAPKGREQNRPRAARRIALDEADRIARVYLEAMDAVGSSGDRDHAAVPRARSSPKPSGARRWRSVTRPTSRRNHLRDHVVQVEQRD
jgi:hypothetical protein